MSLSRTAQVWGLVVCAVLFTDVARSAGLTPAQIAERAIPAVVSVRVPDGLGTGFVVSSDGRIVTNLHVIRGASEAVVVAADGFQFKDVELTATDEVNDLAILRIGNHGLKTLDLGDSSKAKPGQHVVVIGHPLGLGDTVSDGLISAVRTLPSQRNLLQISAPISPGSSGGPVFDDQGAVIGVATAMVEGGQNLNFAVPIDAVKPLLLINKSMSLADYQLRNGRSRHIPVHPASLLENCPAPQFNKIINGIRTAITVGAPLYNGGNIEGCYRVYQSAVLDAQKQGPSCPGPKRALRDGQAAADALKDWDDKAWALRDAFDGLLNLSAHAADDAGANDTVASNSNSTRQIPHHPLSIFKDCDANGIKAINNGIQSAIDSGAPVYNTGNIEACYRIYAGAISDINRRVSNCPAVRQALDAGVTRADGLNTWSSKAWALRDAFDGVTDAIQRRQGNTP